jgi:hypothetical protein
MFVLPCEERAGAYTDFGCGGFQGKPLDHDINQLVANLQREKRGAAAGEELCFRGCRLISHIVT